MLTFKDRLQFVKETARDYIHEFLLKDCINCEWKIPLGAMESRTTSDYKTEWYNLVALREERTKIYVLGTNYRDEEYDFELEELSVENLVYIADEIIASKHGYNRT